MKREYFRRNGGDYLVGSSCPFDGWSSSESLQVHSIVLRLQSEKEEMSIKRLLRAGLSAATLKRVVIMEFGDSASAFDALSPGLYMKDGRERKLGNLGPELS
jgi:hypothetical protein